MNGFHAIAAAAAMALAGAAGAQAQPAYGYGYGYGPPPAPYAEEGAAPVAGGCGSDNFTLLGARAGVTVLGFDLGAGAHFSVPTDSCYGGGGESVAYPARAYAPPPPPQPAYGYEGYGAQGYGYQSYAPPPPPPMAYGYPPPCGCAAAAGW